MAHAHDGIRIWDTQCYQSLGYPSSWLLAMEFCFLYLCCDSLTSKRWDHLVRLFWDNGSSPTPVISGTRRNKIYRKVISWGQKSMLNTHSQVWLLYWEIACFVVIIMINLCLNINWLIKYFAYILTSMGFRAYWA